MMRVTRRDHSRRWCLRKEEHHVLPVPRLRACLGRRCRSRPSPFGWSVLPLWSRSIHALAPGRSLIRSRASAGPRQGTSSAGKAKGLEGGFDKVDPGARSVQLTAKNGNTVKFEIVDDDRSLQISYGGKDLGDIRLLGDGSVMTDREAAAVIVPCREGLLIPADSGAAFQHVFGTSEYEGCHMNMLGLDQERQHAAGDLGRRQRLARGPQHADRAASLTARSSRTELALRQTARVGAAHSAGQGRLEHAGRGLSPDRRAEGPAVTLHQKIGRDPHAERLLGAANVKLWTCLERRMSEDSTQVERQRIHWTFDEAAQVAEHLRNDLGIDRCLFTIGGWTEGGYDCRHPDDLPANPECGGDEGLADAVGRIQELGYVACLHDNYQDMYKDAKSWDPGLHPEAARRLADGRAGAGWAGAPTWSVPRSRSSWPCGRRTCRPSRRGSAPELLHRHDLRRRPAGVLRPQAPARPQRRHRLARSR